MAKENLKDRLNMKTSTNHGNQKNLMNSSSFNNSVPSSAYSMPTIIGGVQRKNKKLSKKGN